MPWPNPARIVPRLGAGFGAWHHSFVVAQVAEGSGSLDFVLLNQLDLGNSNPDDGTDRQLTMAICSLELLENMAFCFASRRCLQYRWRQQSPPGSPSLHDCLFL